MMDTVLNLGITDAVEDGSRAALRRPGVRPRDPRAASSTSSAQTVLGADLDPPGRGRDRRRRCARRCSTTPASEVPTDPHEQLRAAIHAVFGSWSSRRADGLPQALGHPGGRRHRRDRAGDGLRQPRRATRAPGVLFSRDPLSGDARALRRVARRRAGRGRRQRHPRPAAAGGAGATSCPQRARASCSRPRSCSSARTATSRTSSSRSSAAGSTCCRRARPSARRSPPCAPPSTSPTRARSTAPRRSAASAPSSWRSVLAPRLAESVTAAARGAGPRHRRLSRASPAGARRADSDAAEAASGDAVLVAADDEPRGRQRDDRGARRGHRARRLDLARRRRHPRARPARAWSASARASPPDWAGREVTVDGSAGHRLRRARCRPSEVRIRRTCPAWTTVIEWARELSPVAVVDEAPDVLDLDAAGISLDPEGAADVDALTERLRGAARRVAARCSAPRTAPAPSCAAACPRWSGCPGSTRPRCCCGWRAGEVQSSSDERGEESDDRHSRRAAARIPTSGRASPATPTVEAYHTAIRALVAERFAASGKTLGGGRPRPRLRAHARGLREDRGRPAGRRATGSSVGRRLAQGGAGQVQAARGHRRHRRARDRRGGPARSSAPATTSSARRPTSTGTARFVSTVETVMEMLDRGRARGHDRDHRRLRRHADRADPRRLHRRSSAWAARSAPTSGS